ncbi:S4 domain protein [Peptoanaerobacter stomatis]|uniref:S4 domain protein n=1 Tax=Peptoanaerobacter stomatis TaxID=796937 RepID=J6HLZ1_9FIRM|nr:RNA-binding S4 domain-containing protein [Peptoanaerobacter stomatis]EJU23478.1 S4 domain protein [Peptoanaerobacter stomatis]NWO24583.1 RNA-binding S4 domain-containing protein [Peptostreptococcaceae bacterium oral taxon 081]
MEKINIDTPYIKLDQLLKLSSIVSSGAEAHVLITSGKVKVNGNVEIQKRKKITDGDIVDAMNKQIQVIQCK